jgi:hypothetical protein
MEEVCKYAIQQKAGDRETWSIAYSGQGLPLHQPAAYNNYHSKKDHICIASVLASYSKDIILPFSPSPQRITF